MKKRKGLGKILVVGSLAMKGLLFSMEASCPDRINYSDSIQQNLKKSEYMNNNEERGNPNTNHDFYDYFIESL